MKNIIPLNCSKKIAKYTKFSGTVLLYSSFICTLSIQDMYEYIFLYIDAYSNHRKVENVL